MLIIYFIVLSLAILSNEQPTITGSQLIIENEGSHSCMYNNSFGTPLVGIGFNLEDGSA